MNPQQALFCKLLSRSCVAINILTSSTIELLRRSADYIYFLKSEKTIVSVFRANLFHKKIAKSNCDVLDAVNSLESVVLNTRKELLYTKPAAAKVDDAPASQGNNMRGTANTVPPSIMSTRMLKLSESTEKTR